MRRNVARTAGIAVVVPGSTNVVAFFNEEKRVHTSFAQLYGHAKSGETAADDEQLDVDFFPLAALYGIFRHLPLRYLVGCF
jgi:hypothetical protein